MQIISGRVGARRRPRLAPRRVAWDRLVLIVLVLAGCFGATTRATAAGVYVRFKMIEPAETTYYVQVRGFLHTTPWYLPELVVPEKAKQDEAQRTAAGQFTPWFDVGAWASNKLHGRMNRSGGVAEFPNISAKFVTTAESPTRKVIIELATAPAAAAVVKRFEESFPGEATSFLVSPNLKQDADSLETAAQMTARRLAWAREASGGVRSSPTNLIVQTQLWGSLRPDLALLDGEVLWLSGFNLVTGQSPEVRNKYGFRDPGGHDWVNLGLHLTREQAFTNMQRAAAQAKPASYPALFGFSDEIAAPKIGTNVAALAHFHAWLKQRKIRARDLGVNALTNVVPIELPKALKERQRENEPAANRVFYWSTKFRQDGAAERVRWLTEAFRQYGPTNVLTSTLVADHPYFAGSGFGMGMDMPNAAWGNYPLSLNWFDLMRRQAVEVIGIEDWMGLQYMYGP
ncbi:hypothetical protein HQ590_15440, partial [bacterium]|nr:hypothetical protein [bacterium]